MLRLLLLVFLVYGIGSGLSEGWLIIKWGLLFHNVGITSVDPDKPINWSQFIIDSLERSSSKNKTN